MVRAAPSASGRVFCTDGLHFSPKWLSNPLCAEHPRLCFLLQLAVAGILANDLLGLSEKWWIPDNSGHLAPGTEYPGGPRTLFEIIFFAAVESFRVQARSQAGRPHRPRP